MTLQLDRTLTVAQIVTRHPETARVFQTHRIDFCCGGKVPVDDAAAEKGLPADAVFADLERAIAARSGAAGEDVARLPTAALIGHIITRHHLYLREHLPWIGQMTDKLARVHGDRNPALLGLAETFAQLAEAMIPHLDEEEKQLFPMLMSGGDPERVRTALDAMMDEHVTVGGLLARIRSLTDDFSVPDWGCNTYRTCFAELANLETDTLTHVHLENHVLMPRFV